MIKLLKGQNNIQFPVYCWQIIQTFGTIFPLLLCRNTKSINARPHMSSKIFSSDPFLSILG